MRNIFFIGFAALAIGCSAPVRNSSSTLPKSGEESSVILCRQHGGHLALRGIDAYVDGREVTTLRLGGNLEVIVKPGIHTVTFKFPWDSGIQDLGVKIEVPPKTSKNVVIGTNLDGFIVLPAIGGFRSTWRVAEAPHLPPECVDSNRQLIR